MTWTSLFYIILFINMIYWSLKIYRTIKKDGKEKFKEKVVISIVLFIYILFYVIGAFVSLSILSCIFNAVTKKGKK